MTEEAQVLSRFETGERRLLDEVIRLNEVNARLISAIEGLGGQLFTNPDLGSYCRWCDQPVGDFGSIHRMHKAGCPAALAIIAIQDAKTEPSA